MRSLIKSKKGDIFQVLFMLVLVFAVAVVGLICLILTTHVNEGWYNTPNFNETVIAKQSIDTLQDSAPKLTDYTVFFLFLGLNIGVIVGAVRTNFSATIIILFIFLTFFSILVAAGLVNMYQGLAQSSSVVDISSDLRLTNFIFSKYTPLLISIICTLVMLIMYGKSGGDIIQ